MDYNGYIYNGYIYNGYIYNGYIMKSMENLWKIYG